MAARAHQYRSREGLDDAPTGVCPARQGRGARISLIWSTRLRAEPQLSPSFAARPRRSQPSMVHGGGARPTGACGGDIPKGTLRCERRGDQRGSAECDDGAQLSGQQHPVLTLHLNSTPPRPCCSRPAPDDRRACTRSSCNSPSRAGSRATSWPSRSARRRPSAGDTCSSPCGARSLRTPTHLLPSESPSGSSSTP
jgi:hypothetical protein